MGLWVVPRDWSSLAELLQPGIKVHAFDLPGHGTRSMDSDATFESVAEEVYAHIDSLGLERPHLMGYSMGGRVALHLAVQHPGQFASLILESASPGILNDMERKLRREVDDARAETIRSIPLRHFLEDWYRQPLFSSLSNRPDLLLDLVDAKEGGNPEWLALAVSAMSPGRQPSLWEVLPNLDLPAFLIAGELDSKYTKLALAMDEKLPRSELRLVDGAGHCVHAEQPDELAHRLRRMLRG